MNNNSLELISNLSLIIEPYEYIYNFASLNDGTGKFGSSSAPIDLTGSSSAPVDLTGSSSAPSNPEGSNPPANNPYGHDNTPYNTLDFHRNRTELAQRMRRLFENRPYKTSIDMLDNSYSDLDHNIVAKHLMDKNSSFCQNIKINAGKIRYKGIITLQFIWEMEN